MEIYAYLTFKGSCIVIYSYNKSQQDALFHNFILVKNSTCLGQIYSSSSGVLTLYSQELVFFRLVMLSVCQQTLSITGMTNTSCCEYSTKTPDDGQYVCRVLYENKLDKWFLMLTFIIRIYRLTGRSYVHKCIHPNGISSVLTVRT